MIGDDEKASGVAVVQRTARHVGLSRVIPLPPQPVGMAITNDGKLLIVANGPSVAFLDVDRMISGTENALLGSVTIGPTAISFNVAITADDKLLFVSDEANRAISVINLDRARTDGFRGKATLGEIPVGQLPIALVLSPDERWLYTTSEEALPEWNWPKACRSERNEQGQTTLEHPEGAVVVVDVRRARIDPSHSVRTRVPAGCSPVRMAMAPKGRQIYVTARNSNAVLAFDTKKLVADSGHARIGALPTGVQPVPVAVIRGGKQVVVGNSRRSAATSDTNGTLTVFDATKFRDGDHAVIGAVRAGVFPRGMSLSKGGKTLFVTNFGSKSLLLLDTTHLQVESASTK